MSRPVPEMVPCRPSEVEAFLGAVRQGFHGDREPDPERSTAWFEPERAFGFRVGERWVATCAALTKRLTVPGGAAVDVAAVTMVTVASDHRRRGLLGQMMTRQLADVAERGEPVAALWAAEVPIYGRYGYGNATRRLQLRVRTPAPFRRGPDAPGWCELVGRDRYAELVVPLRERLLAGRPGAMTRSPAWWQRLLADPAAERAGASAHRYLIHRGADGEVDGYALYRTVQRWGVGDLPDSELRVEELDAGTDLAYAALWRQLLDVDLVRTLVLDDAPADDALLHLVLDQRLVEARINDALYLRLVDVAAALHARTYAPQVELTIDVRDTRLPVNHGRLTLHTDTDGRAEVASTQAEPDLSLDVAELGSIYLGGLRPSALARAGLITEHRPGALAEADRAFASERAPFCPDHF